MQTMGSGCVASRRPSNLLAPRPQRCQQPSRSVHAQAAGPSTAASEALKADIRRAVTGTARGKAATSAQRASILKLLESLEALNTVKEPARSPMLSGWWALVYQAPLDEAKAAKDKSGTLEGPFLAAFQPLTKGLVKTKANVQLIDLEGGRAENISDFTINLPGNTIQGSLSITGTAKEMAPEQPAGPVSRVLVQFMEFELKCGSLRFSLPLTWVKPTGWIQTTYLDDSFRVGRGDKGSIFVAARIKDRNSVGDDM